MPPEPESLPVTAAHFEHLFGVPSPLNDDWDLVFVGVVNDGVHHYIVCDFVPAGDSDIVPAEHALRPFLDAFEPPIVPNVIAFDDALDGSLPHRRHIGAPEPAWDTWVLTLGAPEIAFAAW